MVDGRLVYYHWYWYWYGTGTGTGTVDVEVDGRDDWVEDRFHTGKKIE